MFAVRVRYLTGRVCAAVFDEGDAKETVEWPPHPSRLFSALVASWGESGEQPELRAALEWLERQPPPSLYFSGCSVRRRVNVYVPVNDESGVCNFLGLTMSDGRKPRTFPSASMDNPDVWFVWPSQLPDELRAPMNELLRRTPSLGHSSSMVSLEIGETPPAGLERWAPGEEEGVRIRVPSAGRLAELVESYQRFREKPSKVFRPSRGSTALYSSAGEARMEPARGIFREMAILCRSDGERAPLTAALQITTALRAAMMKLERQPAPEAISGHAPGSSEDCPAPSQRPHVAFAPLAFVAAAHATGEIQGVAAILPASLSEDERAMVLRTMRRVQELRMAFGVWRVERVATDDARVNLQPYTWMRPSQTWATVTPYVFDRYPRDPYGEEAQETVKASFERVGLPRPASVALMKTSVHMGVPPAAAFPPAPLRAGRPRRFHIHALVVFDREVRGPVLAGAGRFYGYGLFRRVREAE